jgi:hypothetical protein
MLQDAPADSGAVAGLIFPITIRYVRHDAGISYDKLVGCAGGVFGKQSICMMRNR